jgi:hypothetical protein
MAYKCGVCGKAQKSGSKPELVITGKRSKIYPERFDEAGKKIDNGGEGWEITGTKQVCQTCLPTIQKIS